MQLAVFSWSLWWRHGYILGHTLRWYNLSQLFGLFHRHLLLSTSELYVSSLSKVPLDVVALWHYQYLRTSDVTIVLSVFICTSVSVQFPRDHGNISNQITICQGAKYSMIHLLAKSFPPVCAKLAELSALLRIRNGSIFLVVLTF